MGTSPSHLTKCPVIIKSKPPTQYILDANYKLDEYKILDHYAPKHLPEFRNV
jgi:hypothetical protein